jgi:hypothetical protein
MTLGRYLLGAAAMGVALVPLVVGAVRLRRRLVPDWDGVPARLSETIVSVALVLAVAQILGALGAFRLLPMTAGLALVGLGVSRLSGAQRTGRGNAAAFRLPAVARDMRLDVAIGLAAGAVVIGQWGPGVLDVLRDGLGSDDTLSYHGPIAVEFAQGGSITQLEFVYSDPIVVFLPFNSELLHAVGMLFLGSDLLSPFINMGWLVLALLAAWCIGRPYGLGAATVLGVSVVLASRTLSSTQPGGGYNDVVVLALLLASAAFLINAASGPGPMLLAGAAAGVALGSKVTAIAPVTMLTLGVVALAPTGRRLGTAAAWLLPLLATGGVWYLRNWIHVGNPLPGIPEIGPLSLPSPPLPQAFSVAHYATDYDTWRDVFFSQLDKYFGPAWFITLGLALAGLSLSIVAGRTGVLRMLGLVGLATVMAWFFSPRSGGGHEDFPAFFPTTLRYATPGVAMGLALLPLLSPLRARPRRLWVLGGVGLLLLSTLSIFSARSVGITLVVAAAFTVGLRALTSRPRPLSRTPVLAAVGVLALLTVGAGWHVQRNYLLSADVGPPWDWARGLSDTRIALAGSLGAYPLHGRDLSNSVTEIGQRGAHGAFLPVSNCRYWRRAINDGRFRWVATSPRLIYGTRDNLALGSFFGATTPEGDWTRSDPAATKVVEYPGQRVEVFRIDGRLRPQGCG